MQRKDWLFSDETSGEWTGPMTLDALDELHRVGKVQEFTSVATAQMIRQSGPMFRGIPYSMIPRLDIEFIPEVDRFLADRANALTTVLSGPNNSGKTLLLKQLLLAIGQGGYLVGCNRFSHVDVLNTRQVDEHEHRRYFENFVQTLYSSNQNMENNDLHLEQVITGLRDEPRRKLFDICEALLGCTISIKKTDPDNFFSPYYVGVNGENLRYSSTGTRLLLTLLGTLLDERFSVLLIDEPEIGLSPRIQASVARFLYDPEQRRKFCPHLKQLYVTTHSHLFLDRSVFSNNFIVTKAANQISVTPVQSVGDLHQLQFAMLGNELESLFLPSAIVLVEGESDVIYISKLLRLHVSQRKIAVVRAGGDGEMQNKLNVLREAFGDLAASPYRDRLFVALDQRHSVSKERIKKLGVQESNIFVWSRNGIEHLYPRDLTAAAFCCDQEELLRIPLEGDPLEFNGIRLSKRQLAQLVAEKTTKLHALDGELANFVARIEASCR